MEENEKLRIIKEVNLLNLFGVKIFGSQVLYHNWLFIINEDLGCKPIELVDTTEGREKIALILKELMESQIS